MDYLYHGSVSVEPNPGKEGAFIVTLNIGHDRDDYLEFFVFAPHPTNGLMSLEALTEDIIQRNANDTTVRLAPGRDERVIFVFSGRTIDAFARITTSYFICNGQVIEIPGMLDLVDLVGARILLDDGGQLSRGPHEERP